MALVVESFNGTDINTASYSPRLQAGEAIESMAISPVVVRPSGRNGRFIRSDVQARIIPVHITIISGGNDAGQIALAQTFTRGVVGEFVVTYNSVSRALTCRVERTILYDRAPNQFTAVLVAEDPMWHSSALQTVTQQQTVSAATWAVANDGNAADYSPTITVEPVTAKLTASGYLYKREYIIANRVLRPFANYAVMFQIDHATLTTTKSLTSGNDMRVRIDGVETPRWNSTQAGQTWDQATTEVWFNITLSPAKTAVLLTAAASGSSPADGSEIEVVKGGTSGWPSEGAFVIGDEVITYEAITLSNASGHEAFTGIDRAARTSTGAAHSAGDVLYWVEHQVQVIYGYSGAGAPDARNELKPMLDFTSAGLTNTQHEWLDFADSSNPLRSMQWARRAVNRDDQEPAFIKSATGAPAAAMSFVYDSAGPSAGSPLFNQWERDFPSGTDGNIAPTRVVDASLGLQYITVDADGNELKGTAANDGLQLGPLTSAADAHDPGDVYGIRFWAFNQIVAASAGPYPQNDIAQVMAGTDEGFRITTGDQPIVITAVRVYVDPDASVRTITCVLTNNSNGTLVTLPTVNTDGTTNVQELTFTFTTPVTLAPNTVYRFNFLDGAGVTTLLYTSHLYTGGSSRINGADTVWSVNFRVMGYPAPTATSFERCDDFCLATDGDDATITSLIVPLLATGIPYLNLLAEGAAYWLNGTLSNDTTSQTAVFDVITTTAGEIVIDVGRRQVYHGDIDVEKSRLSQVKFSDPDEWFRLAPGSNTWKWTEGGIVRTDITVASYDRWL